MNPVTEALEIVKLAKELSNYNRNIIGNLAEIIVEEE
jgi:hypothetical protein